MFRGNHPTRVDDKNRLKLPAEFKRRVDELYGTQFYVTSVNGKRAQIYPLKEWEAIEAKLAKLAPMDPTVSDFLDVTNYYGQMVEMDSQGRLVVPQVIRESAKIAGEVNVLGTQTYLEVVNAEIFREEMMRKSGGAVEMKKEDLATLSAKMKEIQD